MIPTLFTSVDSADARARAVEFSYQFSGTVTVNNDPLTVAEVARVRSALSPLHLQVVNVDGVSPSATEQGLSLVRSADVVGFSTRIWSAPGVSVHTAGLRSDDSVFVDLTTNHSFSASEAATAARIGRGSVEAAADGLALLSSRTRLLQMLDAVSAHDFPSAMAAAEAFTHEDVAVLRRGLDEISSGDFALFSPGQVQVLAAHRDFAASTVSDYFIAFPAVTASTLAAGLYFAECGTVA